MMKPEPVALIGISGMPKKRRNSSSSAAGGKPRPALWCFERRSPAEFSSPIVILLGLWTAET
jgi:hypothetical protein